MKYQLLGMALYATTSMHAMDSFEKVCGTLSLIKGIFWQTDQEYQESRALLRVPLTDELIRQKLKNELLEESIKQLNNQVKEQWIIHIKNDSLTYIPEKLSPKEALQEIKKRAMDEWENTLQAHSRDRMEATFLFPTFYNWSNIVSSKRIVPTVAQQALNA